jgi:hypothetical protein
MPSGLRGLQRRQRPRLNGMRRPIKQLCYKQTLVIWKNFPETIYKYQNYYSVVEGTKDRVPSGLRGLQRRQRPRTILKGTRHLTIFSYTNQKYAFGRLSEYFNILRRSKGNGLSNSCVSLFSSLVFTIPAIISAI